MGLVIIDIIRYFAFMPYTMVKMIFYVSSKDTPTIT